MTDRSWLSRTELLTGKDKLDKLMNAHVLIAGMGGVGSFVAEFICRSGVGEMTIIDGDVVDPSNRNRQLPALATTHGMSKVKVMGDRLMQINPELKLHKVNEFVQPGRVAELLAIGPDYVVDAIDSITPKLTFMKEAYRSGLPLVSSMGAGGKVDPTLLQVVDISKTFNCPFAQQVRKMLKGSGIYKGIEVVFSPEENNKNSLMMTDGSNYKKSAYGTMSYMPATFGAVVASVVIRRIMERV